MEFIDRVYQPLRAENKAVIGRSAICLALNEGLPQQFKADSAGVDLDDETILGEMRELVRAGLNLRAGITLDDENYRRQLKLHFDYGCQRLQELWNDGGRDQARFVSILLGMASEDIRGGARAPGVSPMPVVHSEVKLKVLADAPEWSMNGSGTKNGLLVISGEPGSGKSQLALDLLAQLSGNSVRFVFFDLKGEMEEDPSNKQTQENRKRFLDQTGAQHVRLIRQDLPINPLYRDPNPAVNSQIANEIAALIRSFAPQLGANQQQALSDAYQQLSAPDFTSFLLQLEQDGVTGVPLSIIKRIVDCNLFASAQTAIGPEQWLSRSLVIDFKEFGNDNDTKALAVALILNFLMKRLNKNLAVKGGIQPLKMVLFVDEAHLLLPKESKAGLLGSLARQGRSWGFPVWLASQDADAFITTGNNATNFAELAECGVHFSPHTLKDAQQKMILGGVIHREFKKTEAALRLQGKLLAGPTRQFWRDGGKA